MREAYNDPPSLKQILKDAPTETNLRKVLRGFEGGVSPAERALFKRRSIAIMCAAFGCALLVS